MEKDVLYYVKTKLDIREFSPEPIPDDVLLKILEAARYSGSGVNSQHWRFIVVRKKENLEKLAEDSTTGKWVKNASLAIIVLTNPRYRFHEIDAGRAVQNMQLVAWSYGIVSCVFTGIQEEKLRKDFNIPHDLSPTIVVGFGYPKRKIIGKKSRKPLEELVFLESYDTPFKLPSV